MPLPHNLQDELNRCMPVAKKVGLGDLLVELVSRVTTLEAQLAALATKLNADGGVTDTNYAPTSAPTPITPIASR